VPPVLAGQEPEHTISPEHLSVLGQPGFSGLSSQPIKKKHIIANNINI
jgi:hypothetical protein